MAGGSKPFGLAESSTVVEMSRAGGEVAVEGALSLTDLFAQQRPRLVLLARIVLDNPADAEDAVSDVFGQLWAKQRQLPDGEELLAYVRVCVLNRARTLARRRRGHRELDDEMPSSLEVDADVARFHEYRAVLRAVRALPPRQMTVLILRFWHDMRIEDVARSMGITAGAVKSHGFKAMRSVRRSLEGAGYGAPE